MAPITVRTIRPRDRESAAGSAAAGSGVVGMGQRSRGTCAHPRVVGTCSYEQWRATDVACTATGLRERWTATTNCSPCASPSCTTTRTRPGRDRRPPRDLALEGRPPADPGARRGIVRIEIVHPRARRLAARAPTARRFGLADAVVVPRPTTDDAVDARRAGRRRLPHRTAPGAPHPRRQLGPHTRRSPSACRTAGPPASAWCRSTAESASTGAPGTAATGRDDRAARRRRGRAASEPRDPRASRDQARDRGRPHGRRRARAGRHRIRVSVQRRGRRRYFRARRQRLPDRG